MTMTKTADRKRPREDDAVPPSVAPGQRKAPEVAEADTTTNDVSAPVNEYAGFRVPVADYEVERIDVRSVTPEEFFRLHVATRKPVVLQGFLRDGAFKAPEKWTDAYLTQCAGDEQVMVERRGDAKEKFGRGVEVPMQFKELLRLIAAGDEMHYLTTQEVGSNDDAEDEEEDGDVEASASARPEIMAPFVAKLQQDFPLQPELLGHLVPQNINIWMGNNKHGSSTGLHHDYHDNLYVLLRGKKRFRLYSPADTERMYTRGELARVHPNGRINYRGEETTAYGTDPLTEAADLASMEKERAERELALAEEAAANGEDGADKRLEAAEKALDEAILGVLRVDREDDEGESEPEDGEFGAFHFDEEDDDGDDENEDDQEQEQNADVEAEAKRDDEAPAEFPVNFSRIDTSLLKDPESKKQLDEQFPAFHEATPAFCELNVGDMLFLPASWFHEVESFGSANGHLAMNYWYHPPDKLDSFETPYSSPYWPQDWALRSHGAKPAQE